MLTMSLKQPSNWSLTMQTHSSIERKFTRITVLHEPCRKKVVSLGFPTSSDTNQSTQQQRIVRDWKFRILKLDLLQS